MPTIGNWGTPANWSSGTVPGAGAVVEIPAGKTVNIGNPYLSKLSRLVIRGTLNFTSTGKGELSVDTVLIPAGGTLQMGTDASPLASTSLARITIFDAAIPASDADLCSRGIIAEGKVRMNGAQKDAFVALEGDALAGATSLTLAQPPAGWQPDDEVVIPATKFATAWSTDMTASDNPNLENEVRRISSINGNVVNLETALAYNHKRPATPAIPHLNYVANLTRNVVIQSESVSDITHRGHVMLMSNDAVIRNALFLRMGRTDKRAIVTDPGFTPDPSVVAKNYTATTNPRGRYALHFHQAGTDVGGIAAQVTGSVVRDTPGWGFVNHASYVDFADNVCFDFDGAGFVAENGDEAGSFIDNIAIGGIGNGMFPQQRTVFGNVERMNQGDMGFHGDGFWFQGPDLTVTGNVAAGNKGSGFTYWCAGRLDPTAGGVNGHYTGFPTNRVPVGVTARGWSYDPNRVLISDIPIKEFSDNIAYANFTGLKFRFANQNSLPVYDQTRGGYRGEITGVLPSQPNNKAYAVRLRQTIADSRFWNNLNGLHATYITNADFRNITNVMAVNVVGQGGIGLSHNIATEDITLTNMKVMHYITGLWVDTVPDPTPGTTYTATGLTITGYTVDSSQPNGIHDGASQPLGFTSIGQDFDGYPEANLVQP